MKYFLHFEVQKRNIAEMLKLVFIQTLGVTCLVGHEVHWSES